MLLQINIKNFALIENVNISFDNGFNVLSGETGAGKSILIDAINFVLGGKFNKDLIRTGEDKTFVEAIFTISNQTTREVLEQFNVDYDDLVIISRETFQSGKSIAKVNGKSLILAHIKLISDTLLNIHGQHENQNLLDATKHISYLDYFCNTKIKATLDSYKENNEKLKIVNSKIKELSGEDGEREKLLDFLNYQILEISNADLRINEDTELESKYSSLFNAEKINKVLSSCYETMYNGSENRPSIYDEINLIIKELKTIEKHLDVLKKVCDSLEEVFYSLEQNIHDIREIKETIYFDEHELEVINSRIYQIGILKKKYGATIEDILTYRTKIENQYEELNNSNDIIEKLTNESNLILNSMKIQGAKLHKIRSGEAKELESKIKKELEYIGLEKSNFKVEITNEENFNENGQDKVQFLISTNPGEPLKPLERIVSGGELSRMMLALKTVFIDKDKIPSVIFDEIDVGVSGRIAQSVAEKMFMVSKTHQVFCVTHLPQIASMSDTHYLISKEVIENKTYTNVIKMSEEQKKHEVAKMIGGSRVTELTLENSGELIKMANAKKNELVIK
jgi:DNA repair protein RecN (Recombination protein N)